MAKLKAVEVKKRSAPGEINRKSVAKGSKKLSIGTLDTLGEQKDAVSPRLSSRKRRRKQSAYHTPRKRAKNILSGPFTCRICEETMPFTAFPSISRLINTRDIPWACQRHLGLRSTEGGPVCTACIQQYLTTTVETYEARDVGKGCMEPGCTTTWDTILLAKHLTPETFRFYCDRMLDEYLSTQPPLITCVKENCKTPGILPETAAGSPQYECVACKTRACAACKVEWHDGMSCQRYRGLQRKRNGTTSDDTADEYELKLVKSMAKERLRWCTNPKCRMVIQKRGGCSMMNCPMCGTDFLWPEAQLVSVKKYMVYEEVLASGICEADQ